MNPEEARQSLLKAVESRSELGYAIMLEAAKQFLDTASEDQIIHLLQRAIVTANILARESDYRGIFSDLGGKRD